MTNPAHFASIISSLKIQQHHKIIVPFDVESLVTNVPIEGAVEATRQKLESDPCLADHTMAKPEQSADLFTNNKMAQPWEAWFPWLLLSLHGGIGRTSNRICKPTKPKIWKHYILDRSNVDCFLQHLDSQQPTIDFTMEAEKDKRSTLVRREDLCRRG